MVSAVTTLGLTRGLARIVAVGLLIPLGGCAGAGPAPDFSDATGSSALPPETSQSSPGSTSSSARPKENGGSSTGEQSPGANDDSVDKRTRSPSGTTSSNPGGSQRNGSSTTSAGGSDRTAEAGTTPQTSSGITKAPPPGSSRKEDGVSPDLGVLTCNNCPDKAFSRGTDLIPTPQEIPLKPLIGAEQQRKWMKDAGAIRIGYEHFLTLKNVSNESVLIDSITMNVIQQRPLPEGYCVRLTPRGQRNARTQIAFDFSRERSSGVPEVSKRAEDDWSLPLEIQGKGDQGFDFQGHREGYATDFVLRFDYSVSGKRSSLSIGSKEHSFTSSSCSNAKKFYYWFTDKENPAGYTLRESPGPYVDL